jgi:hypothetical protein
MIIAFTAVATGLVVILKVALLLPSAMIIVAGTLAAELSLDIVTTAPPAGAGAFRRTVPVTDVPPVTAVELSVIPPIAQAPM